MKPLRLIVTGDQVTKALPGKGTWSDWFDEVSLEAAWKERLQKQKAKPKLHRSRHKEMLSCRLSESELKKIAISWTEKDQEKRRIERELEGLKDEAKDLKASADRIEREIADLATKYRKGVEEREVEVEKRIDYKAGCVETWRLDTGEIVVTRPLNDAERQMRLI